MNVHAGCTFHHNGLPTIAPVCSDGRRMVVRRNTGGRQLQFKGAQLTFRILQRGSRGLGSGKNNVGRLGRGFVPRALIPQGGKMDPIEESFASAKNNG